jgi:FixJ family two-component response regulator
VESWDGATSDRGASIAGPGIQEAAMKDVRPIVFVVDDDRSVRESLQLLIESAGWASEMFGSAREFLSQPRGSGPSCVVLDFYLPDINGCDVQRLLTHRADLPIIFISGRGDVPMTTRAMKAGAVDFFTKPFVNDTLLAAIGDAIGRSRAVLTWTARTRAMRDNYESLSPRQREVMALVVDGRLNKQVGGALGISEITVKAHRGKVMRKMNAGSLPDLVRMADTLSMRSAAKF